MSGYQQPWQHQQYSHHQAYYQHQHHGQQQHQYLSHPQHQQQQLHQDRSGHWQQQLNEYRLPGSLQHPQNGYRQQHWQPSVELSPLPDPRPAKRMRGDASTQQQQSGANQRCQQEQHRMTQQQQQQQQPQQLAAASQQWPPSNNPNPAAAAWLDSLQKQIAALVERVVPNTQEQRHRDACLAAFTSVAAQSLPEHAKAMQVALFGSGAAGLSLHSSDLDVVLTGLAEPEPSTGGFDDASKRFVVQCLRRLERTCCWGAGRQQLGVQNSRLIGRARVPVLKLQLDCGAELDVSLNDDGGIKAARFLQSFQQDFAAVRPLTLLLKCILKQRGLSEVYMGGLGSWSLVNMVLAHLMVMSGTGQQVDHLGSMLLSFLQRFGVDFDLDAEAVAVKRGGFVKKNSLGSNFARKGIITLEDPLTGREVAGGSHRYADVQELFRKLHERLQEALAQAQQQQPSSASGTGRQQPQHVRFGRWGDDDDDDDEVYLDAGNRSPTYKASIRQQRSGSGSSNNGNEWGVLGLLLDCQEAMRRAGDIAGDYAPPAAAAGGVEQAKGGREAGPARQPPPQQQQQQGAAGQHGGKSGSGQWQWGNGADRSGGAAVGSSCTGGSRKRERWQRH